MKKKQIINISLAFLFVIFLSIIIPGYLKTKPNRQNLINKSSCINLKFIFQSMWNYKEDFGTLPYVNDGDSDKTLLLLLKWENEKSSPQLLYKQLENPKVHKGNKIFYETFNLNTAEWNELNKIWERCLAKADFSEKEIPDRAPLLWEKQLIHDSDNLLYIDNGTIETCKDGKKFLKLTEMVKEEIKASRAKTAQELKPTPSTNPSKPQTP